MKCIAALLLVLTTSASAQQLDTPPQEDANPACAKLATIVYKPPKDLILLATKEQHYNRELKLVLTVGEEGLIRDVMFAQSSRNRLVDRAARNWAFGLMFAPADCGDAFQYKVMLPVALSGGTRGTPESPSGAQLQNRQHELGRVYAESIDTDIQAALQDVAWPSATVCTAEITQLPSGFVSSVALKDCDFPEPIRQEILAKLQGHSLPYNGFESVFRRKILVNIHNPQ
ncbi:hypothetical protein ACW5F0_14660 [Luteimonas sp. A534]